MNKITPEQLEKDHAELKNKSFKMEKLVSLEKALGASDETPILAALGALRQLNPGRIPGLRPYATAVYNKLREDWLPGVDLPKLHSEGVIYTGLPMREGGGVFANLDGGTAIVVKDAITGLGEHGCWELRSDGSIMLSCNPSKASLEILETDEDRVLEARDHRGTLRVRMTLGPKDLTGGATLGNVAHIELTTKKQRLINAEASITKLEGDLSAFRAEVAEIVSVKQRLSSSEARAGQLECQLSMQSSKLTALETRLTDVTAVVQGMLHYKEMTAEDGQHLNSPESLPPVGCDLLIKVPKGSYPHAAGKAAGVLLTLDFDEEMMMSATRVCHVQQRGNDLTYRLQGEGESFPGFIIKGQFEWTYP